MPVMITHVLVTTVERIATVTAVMIAEMRATMLHETEAEGGHTSTGIGRVAGIIVYTAITCTLGLVVADSDDNSLGCSFLGAKLSRSTPSSALDWRLMLWDLCLLIECSKASKGLGYCVWLIRLMLQPLAMQEGFWLALWTCFLGIIANS